LRLVRQPETGQREAGEPDAEFLERAAPRDGLGQTLGQVIEFVVNSVPLFWCDRSRFSVFTPCYRKRVETVAGNLGFLKSEIEPLLIGANLR